MLIFHCISLEFNKNFTRVSEIFQWSFRSNINSTCGIASPTSLALVIKIIRILVSCMLIAIMSGSVKPIAWLHSIWKSASLHIIEKRIGTEVRNNESKDAIYGKCYILFSDMSGYQEPLKRSEKSFCVEWLSIMKSIIRWQSMIFYDSFYQISHLFTHFVIYFSYILLIK